MFWHYDTESVAPRLRLQAAGARAFHNLQKTDHQSQVLCEMEKNDNVPNKSIRDHQGLCSSFKGSTIQVGQSYKYVTLPATTHHLRNKSSDTFCVHKVMCSVCTNLNMAQKILQPASKPKEEAAAEGRWSNAGPKPSIAFQENRPPEPWCCSTWRSTRMLRKRQRETERQRWQLLCSSFKGSIPQVPHSYKYVTLPANMHHVGNKNSKTHSAYISHKSQDGPEFFLTSLKARGGGCRGGPVIKCRPKAFHTLQKKQTDQQNICSFGRGAFHIFLSKSGKDLDKMRNATRRGKFDWAPRLQVPKSFQRLKPQRCCKAAAQLWSMAIFNSGLTNNISKTDEEVAQVHIGLHGHISNVFILMPNNLQDALFRPQCFAAKATQKLSSCVECWISCQKDPSCSKGFKSP